MPRICSFYGIVITMYYDEGRHSGRPHFHAAYGADEASIEISVIAGSLPPPALRLVLEWAKGPSPRTARGLATGPRIEALEAD